MGFVGNVGATPCISSSKEALDSNTIAFINSLHCFIITLPALRDDSSRIDSISKLYINRLIIDIGKQILGITPDAMQILCKFSWPYNYTQFTRVMRNLTTITKGQYISSDEVYEVLDKEKTIFSTSFCSKYSAELLDLSLPLSEIDKNIALKVIEVCNGNQTKAAESLKISRTTLWRLIKSK